MRRLSLVHLFILLPCILLGKTREITIPHPSNAEKKIEFFWTQPEGEGPFPMLFLLHGTSFKSGAVEFSKETISYWVDKGFMTVSVSLPGYGKSDGPNDYAGPYTLEGVSEVVSFLRLQSFVDPARVAMIGFGVGGVVATLLSATDLNLSYVVSVNGGYDLLAHQDPSDAMYVAWEKMNAFPINEEELSIRSPLVLAPQILTPLVLFHRMIASPIPLEEVIEFQKKVNSCGGDCKICPLPFHGDIKIPHAEIQEEIALHLLPALSMELTP